jgi:1-deoxy-D-xylulose-5-phosphate synthase
MGRYLDMIDSPADLKKLSRAQLRVLCQETREELIDVVSKTGGHLGASLGAMEITVALHYLYDSPRDKLVWDVGHQAYPHKMFTGRRRGFDGLRMYRGLSGFPRRDESPHDQFGVGHASTSISAALGMAVARDRAREDHHVVAVIGDGGLTGGIAFEALNNAGESKTNITIIINDNKMSISPNVGAFGKYLSRLTMTHTYRKMEGELWDVLGKIPSVGGKAQDWAHKVKESLKMLVVPGVFFEELGFKYLGPIDGHDLDMVIDTLQVARETKGPVVIHALTEKGKGYVPAEKDYLNLHGVGKFDPLTGKNVSGKTVGAPTYTEVFVNALRELAREDDRVVAVTAAMLEGTGLVAFQKEFPDRCFDVGIAEQHAVCFSAGMATQGLKPVAAIYSTFLQRAYDQVVHDVALQGLPVVFAMDRGGLAGADGATHHGWGDLTWMRAVPGMVCMAPKDETELRDLLATALDIDTGPSMVRFPRGAGPGAPAEGPGFRRIPIGSWETLRTGADVGLVACGAMVQTALQTAEILKREGIHATVLNGRFIKPMDERLLLDTAAATGHLVTLEDNVLHGGFGSGVLEILIDRGVDVPVKRFGLPDRFVHHGTREELFRELGLDASTVAAAVSLWLRCRPQVAGRGA